MTTKEFNKYIPKLIKAGYRKSGKSLYGYKPYYQTYFKEIDCKIGEFDIKGNVMVDEKYFSITLGNVTLLDGSVGDVKMKKLLKI